MNKKIIHTDNAPKAIGPYAQAVSTETMVYTAGQIALDPETMELVSGGVEEQTHQVFANLSQVLAASGSDFAHVVKTTVFLKDMADFPKMNAVYAQYFAGNPPARSTVAVAGLPKGGLVEIEVVALLA